MTLAHLKRGRCPTLEKPMETGDGLLVRFMPPGGMLSAADVRAVASLALAHGNGLVDLTRFGNLQLRGVTPQSYGKLHTALLALGMEAPSRNAEHIIPSDATPLGLPFGRADAATLVAIAELAEQHGNGTVLLGRSREIFVCGVREVDAVLKVADALELITRARDSRRMVQACPGAPACAQAEGQTRALALAIAGALPNLCHEIHVSGCAKGCACPRSTGAVVTARDGVYDIAFNAQAGDVPAMELLSADAVVAVLAAGKRV